MRHRNILLVIIIGLFLNGCNKEKKDFTQLVNVFIGSEGDGNTFPGTTMPFGSVQLSPDTGLEGPAKFGSYKYKHNTIIGFSNTHLNGVEEPEYRDILFMPTVGNVQLSPGDEGNTDSGYRSAFNHKSESPSPDRGEVFSMRRRENPESELVWPWI